MPVRTAKLRRFRNPPEHGGQTLMFKLQIGRLGRYLDPRDVPAFEGDEAWFEYEWRHRTVRLLRRVEPPAWPGDHEGGGA